MGYILTAVGEEYTFKNNIEGEASVDVGLYEDVNGPSGASGDDITDGNDVADITTEPGNANYARQSDTYSVVTGGTNQDILAQNDSQLRFDFSDVASGDAAETTIDSYFVVIAFQSTVANGNSEGGANDHLIFTGDLDQAHTTGDIDFVDLDAGGADIELE